MKSMNVSEQLMAAWRQEEAEPFSCWDFSHLAGRTVSEEPHAPMRRWPGDLTAQSESVLDSGTGGGERPAAMRDVFPAEVAATEGYRPYYLLAKERLEPLGAQVVCAPEDTDKPLPFAGRSFDLMLNRHSAYNIAEVERVLRPGGVFLTQQVCGHDPEDLMRAFGTGLQWPFWTLDYALGQLRETSPVVETARDRQGRMVFRDVGAIVYFLKAIPWIVEGFSVETHLPYLQKCRRQLDEGIPLAFHIERMPIQARKPV